jgi:hypothetical protein
VTPRALRFLVASPRAIGLAAAAAVLPAQDTPYGLQPWYADWPVALTLPAPSPAATYQHTRRQALEHVVANLQGNTRREVWLMAMDFFDHAPDDAAEVLVAAVDRHYTTPDVLTNVVEAMIRMPRPEFEVPLRRVVEHSNEAARQAGCAALAACASPATLVELFPLFRHGMNSRARAVWLRNARERMAKDAAPMLQKLMVTSTPPVLRDLILREALRFEPADGAVILGGMWEGAEGEFKAAIAGVLHSAGQVGGSLWLREALHSANGDLVVLALKQLAGRELGMLRDDVLLCSTHDDLQVRFALAKLLLGRPGDDITNVYETLATGTDLIETKCLALHELTLRGRTDAATPLLNDAATATGSHLEIALRLLAASADPRGVQVLCERFAKAPVEDGRQFLQALATSQAKGAAQALLAVFLADDRPVAPRDSHGQQLTTLGYVPVLMLNVRGEERVVIDAWPKLARDDYRRRAQLLQVLCGYASDREDAELRASVVTIARQVLFDSGEVPQLRLQALNWLSQRVLTMDDVAELRRRQEGASKGEPTGMRVLFKDFLFENF